MPGGGGRILVSKLEATQVCDMLHILFRFLLAGWRLTEVETPYADARTTKVQHPSSLSDISLWTFYFFPSYCAFTWILSRCHLPQKNDSGRAASYQSEWQSFKQGDHWLKPLLREVINIHWASLQQTVVLLLYVCMWRPHAPAYRGTSGVVLLCSLVKDAEKHRHSPLADFHSSFLLNFVFDVHKRLFYGRVRINIIKLCLNEL